MSDHHDSKPTPSRSRIFRGMWSLMEGDRLRYGLALASLLAAAGMLYLVPLVPQAVIDVVLGGEPEKASGLSWQVVDLLGGRERVADALWLPLLLITAIATVAGVFTYGRQRWSAIASQNTARRIRDRLQDRIQRLDMRSYDRLDRGDLLQRCTSDVDTTQVFLSTQVVEVGRAIVMLAVAIPIMFVIDWRMATAAVWLLPLITGFSFFYFKKVRALFKDKDEAEGRLTAAVNDNLVGIRVVRAFNRQDHEIERFRPRNDDHRRLDARLYTVFSTFWSLSDLLCFMQQASVVLVGAWLLADGRILVGEFYFFFAAVGMYLWPVRMAGRIVAEFGKATVAIDRIEEILELPVETEVESEPERIPDDGSISFRGIGFAHTPDQPVLDGIDLEIADGETVAIVGPSGCGKSTLVQLLLRFYEPDTGHVEIGGVDIRTLDRHDLRTRVATVLQQPFLFSRTIRENILLADPGADHASIEIAAGEACIHDSIQRFDSGYETMVGERGLTLSGGQRQRIAIAQALLQKPSILVLDDALSAVDTGTERSILEAIRSRRGRHTTVVIAHRLSTLREADRIVVMSGGRIEASGTHAELRDRPGLYRRLWDIQSSLEADDDRPLRRGEEASS
ncbi:MAG: ABC transporter [Phycisphaerae bacterium]|nr:ABC transporter [Phycisphaerae bacterium]